MAKSLRSNEHQIIGFSAPLPKNVLPTKLDVVKYMQLCKDDLELKTGRKKHPVTSFAKPVIEELLALWQKASIPTITEKGVEKPLIKLWQNSYLGMRNDYAKNEVQEANQKLFDICACKCKQIPCTQAKCVSENCDGIHLDCNCESQKKIPKREIKFLFDQRGPRKMIISGLDQKVTQSLQRSQKKADAFEAQQERERKRIQEEAENNAIANQEFFAEEAEVDPGEKEDPDFVQDASTLAQGPKTRNTHPLPKTGAACDRWGISSKAAADIVNSFTIDMGLLTEEDKATVVVDKAKIDRWRKKGRTQAKAEQKKTIETSKTSGIYFDGKKDLTLTKVLKDGKPYQKKVIEDHYVMIGEPDNIYLGHEVPYSGHGISLGLRIFRSLKEKNLAARMRVAGADGCNVNVGNNEGALVYLEKLLGTPLHWFICMLHGCELPFREIVRAKDGGTTGPHSREGPIGSTLDDELTELDVVNYQSIPNPDFPTVAEDDSYDMSKDQDYMLRMSHAIMSGIMPPGLPNEDPGLLSPARWGTMANRFMRKYVSTLRPSRPFCQIIFSIIHFWAPSWFQIMTHPRAIDGPRNLLKMVQYL